jgi:hypothetical protein
VRVMVHTINSLLKNTHQHESAKRFFILVLLLLGFARNSIFAQFQYTVSYPTLNVVSAPSGQGELKSVNVYLFFTGSSNSKYKLFFSGTFDTLFRTLNTKGHDTLAMPYGTKMTPFVYKIPNTPLSFIDINNRRKSLIIQSESTIRIKGFLDFQLDSWSTGHRGIKGAVKDVENIGYPRCMNNFVQGTFEGVFPCFNGKTNNINSKNLSYISINSYTPILYNSYPWWFYGSRQILQVLSNSEERQAGYTIH